MYKHQGLHPWLYPFSPSGCCGGVARLKPCPTDNATGNAIDIRQPFNTMQTTHYTLKLSNGHGWHIIAGKQAAPWVNRLATIMELKRSELNGYPKLIFLDKDEEVGDASFTGLNMADMPGSAGDCMTLNGSTSIRTTTCRIRYAGLVMTIHTALKL